MGVNSLLGSQHAGIMGALPRNMDTSILSTVAEPDPDAQRKYEAMGLPDPVAFAALAALGAVPNPMAMLNKMMLAAQDRIDQDADRSGVSPASPLGRSAQ